MKVRDAITTAGGTRGNEDRVGHPGSLAWVIDGATDLYQDAALPADSDVQWLVDLVGQQLTDAGARGYSGAGAALLERVADEIAQRQTAHGFPTDRVPPACSIVVVVDQGDTYDITRVGDAIAVVAGVTATILATDYFDRREAAAVDARRHCTDPEQVLAGMHQRRLHTMTAGDTESVLSGHPQHRLRPHGITGGWDTVDHVLLCTDGFARLLTDYRRYPQWTELIAVAQDQGLAYLEQLIRDTERQSVSTPGRFKHADDVAALLLTRG
jgi:hypothetical protein